jgi:predicted Zn-dependent peptidase
MAFPAYERSDALYYESDLLSDILASGRSSRLYQQLVKTKPLFTYIDAYITGTFDKGLLVIEGKVSPGVTLEDAEEAVWNELDAVCNNDIELPELQKIKNKAESSLIFSELGIMHRAINLCFYEALGDIDLINKEGELYQKITPDTLKKCAVEMFAKNNASVLYYQKN